MEPAVLVMEKALAAELGRGWVHRIEVCVLMQEKEARAAADRELASKEEEKVAVVQAVNAMVRLPVRGVERH